MERRMSEERTVYLQREHHKGQGHTEFDPDGSADLSSISASENDEMDGHTESNGRGPRRHRRQDSRDSGEDLGGEGRGQPVGCSESI